MGKYKGFLLTVSFLSFHFLFVTSNNFCNVNDEKCEYSDHEGSKYSEGENKWELYRSKLKLAILQYQPCNYNNCTCYADVIERDLSSFASGISEKLIYAAKEKGTKYQIINHRLYRTKDCMFPARCAGVEHFLLKIVDKLPDTEFILNPRDWPQVHKNFGELLPIFSFSKSPEYADIMYPAWAFWEGGPAIKLYPKGLGRWDQHRKSLSKQAKIYPWEKKKAQAFFRGSRTSSERDPLVLLSREQPELVDAQYTKNQAWKSEADTLNAPPAEEVSFEEHCQYKYLFNFRGVAASFRFKHLFLCQSLVFHVGDEWVEFFYPLIVPWVHYIPVPTSATKEDIRQLLMFAQENDELVHAIAERGFEVVWKQLQNKDVLCYWELLLKRYTKLLTYGPKLDKTLLEVKQHN